jgi:hypothetical protein
VLNNFDCRTDQTGVTDLWVRVNHIGIDGMLAQEIVSRLEAAWGLAEPLIYPTPEQFAPHSIARDSLGSDGIVELQAFLDFSPLLAWRKTENARQPEPMTLSAALIWCLARHPTFADLHVGTTVDVPATDELPRGVGIVVIRPADYFKRDDGLRRYVRDFNRQLDLTRRRVSTACKTLDAVALLKPKLASAVLHHALNTPRAFGSMGVTILRDAKVFGAPLGDAGHPNGFIAIGGVQLPAGDGRTVGCVMIKGPAAKVAGYPTSIREAIERCTQARLGPP